MIQKNVHNNNFIRRNQIHSLTDYHHLLSAVKRGDMIRIRRGVYATKDGLASTMIDINAVVPGGVLCLYSAWSYYELTTQIPDAFYIAIQKKRKVTLPDYPPIELSYWSEIPFKLGIIEKEILGYKVQIYDLEKSVCDAIKFRNKIGVDVSSEILKNYLKRSDRDLMKLNEYSHKMRIAGTMDKLIKYMI